MADDNGKWPLGVSLHDLVSVFEAAERTSTASDNLAGNPERWGKVRGVRAVAAMVMLAMGTDQEKASARLKILEMRKVYWEEAAKNRQAIGFMSGTKDCEGELRILQREIDGILEQFPALSATGG